MSCVVPKLLNNKFRKHFDTLLTPNFTTDVEYYSAHRKTRFHVSAEDIKALTASPFLLASAALEPPAMVDATEQLKLQVLTQSSPLMLQLEHHPPMETQKHRLEHKTDQANHEDIGSHLAGKIFLTDYYSYIFSCLCTEVYLFIVICVYNY